MCFVVGRRPMEVAVSRTRSPSQFDIRRVIKIRKKMVINEIAV